MHIGVDGRVQHGQYFFQPAAGSGCGTGCSLGRLLFVAAKQPVEFFRHPFPVKVQAGQQRGAIGQPQCVRDPLQIGLIGGQHMGLLIVQVLDAVLHLAQKNIGLGQLERRVGRQQPRRGQALQRAERGAGAQLRKLSAPHHLQQLHDELELADAAARQLYVVGTLRVGGAALGGVFADLAVQDAQRIEHAVVQVAAKNKGRDQRAQCAGAGRADGRLRRDHPRLEPGQALPLAALALKIIFQRAQ